jgi:hypothetical protein
MKIAEKESGQSNTPTAAVSLSGSNVPHKFPHKAKPIPVCGRRMQEVAAGAKR